MSAFAVISGARLAAAHDGVAELIVELRYDNGGTSEVSLDEVAASALMARCNASTLSDLNGHDWQAVKEALSASWNRFST